MNGKIGLHLKQDAHNDYSDVSSKKMSIIEAATIAARSYMLSTVFDNMLNGFAYCQMIFEQGCPKDFIYLAVNGAFGALTGLRNVTGKRVSEIVPAYRNLIQSY